jgi:hypothetical protein
MWYIQQCFKHLIAFVAQAFRIVLDKSVVLSDVKIAGRGGALLDCFDLFVGQRIDVLGKPTTLLQGAPRC